MLDNRTAESAIEKLRKLSLLPKGTKVLARQHFRGVIDGLTSNGDYIVRFFCPVRFHSIGREIIRGSFPTNEVVRIEE